VAVRSRIRWLPVAVLVGLCVALVPGAGASAASCAPVLDPYPGTRYEGVDLTKISAKGIACPRARKVAKGAHLKALGITPPPDGIRTFRWRGWRVVGNLRPASDKYTATRDGERVGWRF
jgi:hypothetical protein